MGAVNAVLLPLLLGALHGANASVAMHIKAEGTAM